MTTQDHIEVLKREIKNLPTLNSFDAEHALEELIIVLNNEWQPIETCVYNFEEKILISDGENVAYVWMETNGRFYHRTGQQGYYEFAQFYPTHWRPLPAPSKLN